MLCACLAPNVCRAHRGRSERWVHGTGVTGVCELLCGYSESNLGPLEEESVLLTTESSPG